MSTRSPSLKDRIFVSAVRPTRADGECAFLTTRALSWGGSRPFRGSCPMAAASERDFPRQDPPLCLELEIAHRRAAASRCRGAIPFVFGRAGEFAVIPCSGESFPVPATKIPCSGCAGNLCPTRSNRSANRPPGSAGWAEKPQIPCYFPCTQGIRPSRTPIADSGIACREAAVSSTGAPDEARHLVARMEARRNPGSAPASIGTSPQGVPALPRSRELAAAA